MQNLVSFVTPDVVRITSSQLRPSIPGPLYVHEWSLSTRRLAKAGAIGEEAISTRAWPLPDGTLFVSLRQAAAGARRGLIVDGRTAAVLRELPPGEAYFGAITRLPDGRYATIASVNHRSAIRIEGRPDIDLGGDYLAYFGGELAPGRLVVSAIPRADLPAADRNWQTLIVDTATGVVVKRFDDIRAAASEGGWMYAFGSSPTIAAPRLFLDRNHDLVMVDPATWTRKKVL
jgi:hypothetical protein